MKLIITIDTEEDNWNRYRKTDNPVRNIQAISTLQKLFDRFDVKPTYLITYPVATNRSAIGVFTPIVEKGRCEIAMHCHPWNTPPLHGDGPIRKADTMMCNLPAEMVYAKMATLHNVIRKNYGVCAVSFRAGRYGFGPHVANALCRLGYRYDSSVTPFTSWQQNQGADFTSFGPELFRFGSKGLQHPEPFGPLLQVPVTIGYLQSNFDRCHAIESFIETNVPKRLHLKGVLERLKLLNKIWLSPEQCDAASMIAIAKCFARKGMPCINMTFHSSSLIEGLSPFVRNASQRNAFYSRIETFLKFAAGAGWQSQTLSEFGSSQTLSRANPVGASTGPETSQSV